MKKEERIARQKKLARAVQVREAQRRRRARLKSENQKFLQIIVPDDLRDLIFSFGNEHDLTLQEAAVVLIQKGLGMQGNAVIQSETAQEPMLTYFQEAPTPPPMAPKETSPTQEPTPTIPTDFQETSVQVEELPAPPEDFEEWDAQEPVDIPSDFEDLFASPEEESDQVVEEETPIPVAAEVEVAPIEIEQLEPPQELPKSEPRASTADDGQLSFF